MDSYDFEEQLIGSMIIKGDHIDCHEITGKLPADAFENFHLRSMYKVIVALLSKCEPIDPFTIQDAVPDSTKGMVLTVSSRCKSLGKYQSVGQARSSSVLDATQGRV
ncbi:DnaB-like helicase N-terminal domain-containing protein [Yersinia enterocolitica]|uniref:DnaB-like helicase N-terminal domain-containing protein n=1 Tax=Yersinia enterocolitica TaxID=630 RepID=UPI003D7B0D94